MAPSAVRASSVMHHTSSPVEEHHQTTAPRAGLEGHTHLRHNTATHPKLTARVAVLHNEGNRFTLQLYIVSHHPVGAAPKGCALILADLGRALDKGIFFKKRESLRLASTDQASE